MTPPKRVRLADIAELAEVTIPTVSYVLAGRAREKRINVELEKRIREIAKRLGYRPNLLARSLIMQRSMTIGVLVANLGRSFYPAVMARLHHQMRKHGYFLLFTNHYLDAKLFSEETQALLQRSVDAMVLGPIPELDKESDEIRSLAAICPVVAFEWSHPSIDSVLNCPQTLGTAAADYLLQKKSRKVLAISLSETGELLHGLPSVLDERLQSFNKRFESRSGNQAVVWPTTSAQELNERLSKAMATGELSTFDGFFFPQMYPSEQFFIEVLRHKPELLEHKQAITITGQRLAPHLQRYMATLYQNPETIGDHLAEKLLARIENREIKPQTIDVPADLIERS